MNVSSEQTKSIVAAAEAHAELIGVPVCIAVLDASAQLKIFSRMDGALLGSVDIAQKKAKTAALFGMNSEAVGDFCKPGGTSPGLELTNDVLVVFAGGIPIHGADGTLLGAVGISGGAVTQDKEIAQAAIAAFTS